MSSRAAHFLATSVAACLVLALTAPTVSRGQTLRQPRLLPFELEDVQVRPVVTAVCLQPQGVLAAAAGDKHCLRVWDRTSGELRWSKCRAHDGWIRTIAVSPDGETLASAGDDGQISLWNFADGEQRPNSFRLERPIRRLAFSHRGDLLAATVFGDGLHVLNAVTGERIHKLACVDSGPIAFSPDDRSLATGSRNGVIRVWRLENAADPVHRDLAAHRRRVRDLKYSPDGNSLFSCSDDGTLYVWRGDEIGKRLAGCDAKLFSLALLDEGRVACGASDNRIRVWNQADGQLIDEMVAHAGTVAALAAEDSVLISAGFDTRVKLWRVARRDEAATVETSLTTRPSSSSPSADIERNEQQDHGGKRIPPNGPQGGSQ